MSTFIEEINQKLQGPEGHLWESAFRAVMAGVPVNTIQPIFSLSASDAQKGELVSLLVNTTLQAKTKIGKTSISGFVSEEKIFPIGLICAADFGYGDRHPNIDDEGFLKKLEVFGFSLIPEALIAAVFSKIDLSVASQHPYLLTELVPDEYIYATTYTLEGSGGTKVFASTGSYNYSGNYLVVLPPWSLLF